MSLQQKFGNVYTVAEVAEYLKASPDWIYRLCNEGELGGKIGGKWYIKETEIEKLLKKQDSKKELKKSTKKDINRIINKSKSIT